MPHPRRQQAYRRPRWRDQVVVDRIEPGGPLPESPCLQCQLVARFNRDSRHGHNGQCLDKSIKDVVELGNGCVGRPALRQGGRFGCPTQRVSAETSCPRLACWSKISIASP
jgi:hypothetical protein